jgi:hypothetical protein
MTGSSPNPPGFGAPPPGSGPPPPLGGPGYRPQAPADFGPVSAPKRPRTGLLASGVVLAVLLGIAALVLSIRAVTRSPESPPPSTAHQAEQEELFVEDADKALCEVIGPLMREETERANAFLATGEPNSPERKGAIPKFKADTFEWANRLQSLLNKHAEPPRYLTRTLQNYIDGMLLYSENMYPDRPPDAYDNQTYDSAAIAYGGPLGTCYKVGVRW